MQIAVVVADLFGTGAVASVARLESRALTLGGHDVTVLTTGPGDVPGARVVAVPRLSLRDPLRHASSDLSFAIGAGRALRKLGEFDLTVLHSCAYGAAVTVAGRRHTGMTAVVLHALIWERLGNGANPFGIIDTLFYRATDRQALRAMDATISVSDHIRQTAVRRGADPRTAFVRRNPVDTERFSPPAEEDDRPVDVVFVGRLSAEKGAEVLIDALSLLPALRVVVIGDGRLRGSLEAKANGRAQFLGPVDQTLIPGYFRQAKVCVLPSLSDSAPLVALEAMACGTPVIGSRAGGIPEVVSHGKNGWLVEPGDVRGLRDAIESALSMDLADRRIAARGTATEHSLDKFRREVCNQYAVIARTGESS